MVNLTLAIISKSLLIINLLIIHLSNWYMYFDPTLEKMDANVIQGPIVSDVS